MAMMEDAGLIRKVLSAEGAVGAFIADDETFMEVCRLEEGVSDTSFGMRMENRALEACKECPKRIVVFCTVQFEPPDCHVMVMEDADGKRVGSDVPGSMREQFLSDPDLIWMGEDFVVSPCADIGGCRMVMLPQEIKCLGEAEGVGRAVILYPSMDADAYLKEKFGADRNDAGIASGIIGCCPL